MLTGVMIFKCVIKLIVPNVFKVVPPRLILDLNLLQIASFVSSSCNELLHQQHVVCVCVAVAVCALSARRVCSVCVCGYTVCATAATVCVT